MRTILQAAVALLVMAAVSLPVPAAGNSHGFMTSDPALITLNVGGVATPIISVGEVVDGVKFEGIPDGIGLVPTNGDDTVDVYVAHEQTTIPFRNARDFIDASVTRWTLDTDTGQVLNAAVAISSDEGFLRFCSASVATPDDGFDTHVFFANEETNDVVDRPPGASYQPDPAVAPQRQGGYAVALDTATGDFEPIAGMGRHNHENTVAVPGYDELVLLSTDDTFTATTSQFYMYLVDDQKDLFKDKGSLWAFRVTQKNGDAVDTGDPFNDANDYLDLGLTDEMRGEFIRVPKQIARGQTREAPQDALENWSVENNVFTFVRLEDVAVDKNDSRIVYVADTGASRVLPDPDTGRLHRPSGATGLADNGRMFKLVFNDDDPTQVDSFTVLADGDAPEEDPKFVGFTAPDNIDTSVNSLMVQEDADDAQIWQYKFADESWTAVADVVDTGGESSGIVDASAWFGPGSWLLDVQAHDLPFIDEMMDGDITIKREEGQLLLMNIPGS
ncbi:MAG: DUF839 domain-containing protein [Acidimicrobiia bacterium]|nr:DUF839 domain-containing protein [Acidimicrobiia bacterium]